MNSKRDQRELCINVDWPAECSTVDLHAAIAAQNRAVVSAFSPTKYDVFWNAIAQYT
jgi:hypothetical protein